MNNRILFVADKFISHDILSRLFLNADHLVSDPDANDFEKANLVIADARQMRVKDIRSDRGAVARSLEAGTPIVLLSPGLAHLEALKDHLPAVDTDPCQAMLISRENLADGAPHYFLDILGLTIIKHCWSHTTWNFSSGRHTK